MRWVLIAVAIAGLMGRAHAFDEADRAAVQSVIEQQIQAFSRDDGTAAYSFASPGIKQMFPTEEIFMNLVRQGYEPVYRHRSRAFGALEENGSGLKQAVDIVDSDGTEWTAVYTMERQPDGTWAISGCTLVKKPGLAV